ncbi:acetate kinase [Loktanella ponticola]|uniref:Acetate kinase n=1 Tax=Yoonia ponticola TaxID=1524255 RepID=A0A7W9EYP2_9RHOB|nr:acetate kinase [Yoonia ponticola]MBB5721061.1 acetate kinase [Yoonia ponticola]
MILVVNAGSSSLKVALFDRDLNQITSGIVREISGESSLQLGDVQRDEPIADHTAALTQILALLADLGHTVDDLTAAAHRVVHGGATMTTPVRLDADKIAEIKTCIPLAPLHNPANLSAIHALAKIAPKLTQFASFDTAFHATNPDVATRYAISEIQHSAGIRRYGFHGLSYANMVAEFGDALPSRLLALHLGNGASLCAIKDGKSVATSMGYSPLSGLTMGTRSGDIDGAAVLRISDAIGEDATDRMLNENSGLKALAGASNMKTLLDRDDDAAKFAVDHFCYWAARHAGSAIVAMGGVDAVAFTGGIGENAAPIRDRIMAHLSCFGTPDVHVIAAEEEKAIARDALSVMAQA